MGGVWHFLDFSHSSKSRKKSTGMEVARNSVELPSNKPVGCHVMFENIQPSRGESCSSGSSTTSSIDEVSSSRSSISQKAPSVIARLMGMDAFPLEIKSPETPKEGIHDANSRSNAARTMYGSGSPFTYKLQDSMPAKQRNGECYRHSDGKSSKGPRHGSRSSKPKVREHPQEAELEKFKKEFLAWQSNKDRNRPRSVGVNSDFQKAKERQKFAHERIDKDENVPTVDAGSPLIKKATEPSSDDAKPVIGKRDTEPSSDEAKSVADANPRKPSSDDLKYAIGEKPPVSRAKMIASASGSLSEEKRLHSFMKNPTSVHDLHQDGFASKTFQSSPSKFLSLGNRKKPTRSTRLVSIMESDEENHKSPSPPKKTVILKLGFEDIDEDDDGRTSCCSPEMIKREGSNIDAFLEEVKEKLRVEVQGTSRFKLSLSGDKRNTPPFETPKDQFSSPKLTVQRHNMEIFLGEVKERLQMEVQGKPRHEAMMGSFPPGRTGEQCSPPELIERECNMEAFLVEVKEKLGMEVLGKSKHCPPLEQREQESNMEVFLGGVKEKLRMGVPGSFKDRSPPELIEQGHNMDAFLLEVKEKLRMELLGKSGHEKSPGSQRLDNFSKGRPSDPKQIAPRHARDSFPMDLEMEMSSEAVSSRHNHPTDKSDSRGSLPSHRFKNVTGNDRDNICFATTDMNIDSADAENYGSLTSKNLQHNHWEDDGLLNDGKTSSFREEEQDGVGMSPRNLVRSLSAPVSGAAFRRFHPEDQCLSTDDHIHRQNPEADRSMSGSAAKSKRDKFNLKGRVSSLKHNLGLRGKLFSKKAPPAQEFHPPESDFLHTPASEPSLLMNLGTPQDILTEVPPSPASVTSSMEDYGRPGQPSPISPLEVPFSQGHSQAQFTKDIINSKLLVEDPQETMMLEEEANEADVPDIDDEIVEVTDQDEGYIRDVLVKAGLFGRMPTDKVFSRWKMLCQSIPISVFEEVEEAYNICEKTDAGNFLSEAATSRKLLFDLLNEALPCLLGSPCTRSADATRFMMQLAQLHGKKLLQEIWQQILDSTQALDEEAFSLDRVIAEDLRMTHWSGISRDSTEKLAMDLESMILEHLLEEFVQESLGLITEQAL